MKKATALLTSYNRQNNLIKIINCLKGQSESIDIFLWNNCDQDQTKYDVDLQINSSKNLMCLPRWFLANYAQSEFVFSLDDDVIPVDQHLMRDSIEYMQSNACSAIGHSGVQINNVSNEYKSQKHVVPRSSDIEVDIIKGFFLFTRKNEINLPNTCSVCDYQQPRVEDDIIISSNLKREKIIPSFLKGRLRKMKGFEGGLHSCSDHYHSRTSAMRTHFV